MTEAKNMIYKNKTVYFTGAYWRPYIYYYYYFRIDPRKVQEYNNSTHFDRVYFGYAAFDRADRRYDYDFKNRKSLGKRKFIAVFVAGMKEVIGSHGSRQIIFIWSRTNTWQIN